MYLGSDVPRYSLLPAQLGHLLFRLGCSIYYDVSFNRGSSISVSTIS